ncbi:hypothetical protein WN944_025891 [Citrus x changshan-huyou]|uniref:Uncharacterized protein n=1 Tax=Citrus x changshan-huyou TaxID=2935761 RepID=A0AAP0LX33_9ROSI
MQGQKHFLVHPRLLLWHDGLVEVTGLTLNLLCSANFIFQTVTFTFSFVHCVDDSVVCFMIHTGGELLRADSLTGDALLKQLWQKGKWGKKMSKRGSGVHVGREQKEKWSGVYVGSK